LLNLTAGAVSIAFHRLTEDLSISNLRFHDLRHDVASTLTMAGVSQRAVMEILGHKDPRMTLRYQHLSPGHLQKAMSHLNRQDTENELKAEAGQ
jgi:integrase